MAPGRTKLAPEIPTAAEAGYPGMIAQNSFGLFAPAGTPKDIVAQIVQATHTAMADDDFRNRLIATGLEPYVDSSPEAAQGFVNEEIRRWAPVIKAIGLKVE
jgi:tripartite-type tricarboxylate transporter receptor subunit TctC